MFVPLGEAVLFGVSLLFAGEPLEAGELVVVGVVFTGTVVDCGAGVGVAAGALSGADCSTERCPVNDGKASVNAISMNAAAAPIVILARRLAVPRGPNAVLDKLLENSAPASALPGCNRMTTIKTTQDSMKSPYKR